ncbi:MAG: gamma-glutamylcyclotransferase [Paracoccaceae bacterium]
MQQIWIFGYGSLIWNPGFRWGERVIARLVGYQRSFCMHSIHHRGSPEAPGLVLALDAAEGAICDGVAFCVAGADADETLAYLRERELISSAYREAVLPLDLADGRRVDALAYVIDRDHVQYCGDLALEEQASIIAHATGGRGPNAEYLHNTVQHLDALGLEDAPLRWLDARVRSMVGQGS